MRSPLPAAVGRDLLPDALAYADGVLRLVPDRAGRTTGVPTPCRGWDLAALLAHLEDALDAFIEAAEGAVQVDPPYPADHRGADGRPARLRRKAEWLGRAWTRARPGDVRLGERTLPADLLVPAAALEVAVHAWDVAWALGEDRTRPLPRDLARALAPAAALLVPPGPARAGRFDEPPADLTGPEVDLLGWLGRDAAPLGRPPGSTPDRPLRRPGA